MNELKLRFIVILNAAWRQRYVIVLPILLMPFAGYFVGKMAPEKYISHTSMLIQETAKMNPFLEDLAVSTMLKERLTALRTLLKSRHILRSVAAERGLTNDAMSPKQVGQNHCPVSIKPYCDSTSKGFSEDTAYSLKARWNEGITRVD